MGMAGTDTRRGQGLLFGFEGNLPLLGCFQELARLERFVQEVAWFNVAEETLMTVSTWRYKFSTEYSGIARSTYE